MIERVNSLFGRAADVSRGSWREYLFFLVVTLGLYIFMISGDAYQRLDALVEHGEDTYLDELLTGIVALSFTSLLYLIVYSRRLRTEMHRRAEVEQQLATALNTMRQGLAMFGADERLILCNPRFAEIYNMPDELTKPGADADEVMEACKRQIVSPLSAAEHAKQIRNGLDKAGMYAELRQQPNGRVIDVLYFARARGGWVSTHTDITERRQAEERVAHMAYHDTLTDLPNRALFKELIAEELQGIDSGESVAVMCLDLDRFKAVNDTLGHPIGDKLLQIVAERLRGTNRKGDHIARFGGDEFAIVQSEAEQPQTATATARRIIEALSSPYVIDGHQIVIGASIGIVLAPCDGREAEELLKNADLALYRAKTDGRGTFHFFEPGMDAQMQARRRLEMDLRSALAENAFELLYQPIVNVTRNEVTGIEALLRWRHPERGLISPNDFIPLAEEIGLIIPLGEWVLRQACRDVTNWPGELPISVNLSPSQFRSANLVGAVKSALQEAKLPAHRLELEITEGVLLAETEATIAILNQLHALGVRIAMDDFGTGYSSLSYFRSFHFDRVKIDRSFIRNLATDDSARAIIRAVAGLSANLGMATTAEGVETKEQLEQLRAEGYDNLQGFFFSPPRPAREIANFLATVDLRNTAA